MDFSVSLCLCVFVLSFHRPRIAQNISLQEFMYRKNQVQVNERQRAARNLERHHIERLHGTATIADPHTVIVHQPGSSDRETADPAWRGNL